MRPVEGREFVLRGLALRELEPPAGLALPGLLAFNAAGVAGEIPGAAERGLDVPTLHIADARREGAVDPPADAQLDKAGEAPHAIIEHEHAPVAAAGGLLAHFQPVHGGAAGGPQGPAQAQPLPSVAGAAWPEVGTLGGASGV